MKMLLLEDDILLNTAITHYLSSIGHAITSVRDGNVCLNVLQTKTFDLLIFDINVPNIDGLSIIEKLHAMKKMVPVIFISTLIDIEDITRAFELGCFDYLKKPFHLKELGLRINKIAQSKPITLCHKRLSKCYSYNSETMALYFNDTPEVLSKRQLKIIDFLAHNKGFVCSYEMFMEHVWDDVDVDIPTIRAEINRLKHLLKEDFIVNIRGIGYMVKRSE
ncbi:response regulator transcription factor [Sulfurospirillum barnesii]|uniref:Response regulator with CheY-like receiver domain and winged-helix DNA-binding domain n=1 Tax=Sulfurospirillum barnesii (strain ATCC 700032 / DSM 10660 / SES-3) TaxID=760154 RepID=I3XYN4_SULBS|nr:response regulator transcription factor [Sulfurospirillum barnesii]AFL69058.1 response regulator with CheY-like receiver domain and winged-helix DNA-binding domain [Sulfurospirillum barnesii SES-3]